MFCDRSKCIFLNRTPNRWSNHAYVQVFYCESITFKAAVNMFECIEISESIYEVVVETSYKKNTRSDTNRDAQSRKIRGEFASSNTYSKTIERSGKHRKRYVYNTRDISKHTFIIHGPGHSSDECKVLGVFGFESSKIRHTKVRRHDPVTGK